MTLSAFRTLIESVNDNAFKDKVAYRAFPVGEAPELPFVCLVETETDNMTADSKVYAKRQYVNVELYEDYKDPDLETALETVLDDNNIIWNKAESYIDDEDTIMVVYEVVIDGKCNQT